MKIKKMVYKRINSREEFSGLVESKRDGEFYFTTQNNRLIFYKEDGTLVNLPELEREMKLSARKRVS